MGRLVHHDCEAELPRVELGEAVRRVALVAERNSSLGLVMADSQRFVYEQALLAGLRDCRERLARAAGSVRADPDLLAQLDSTVTRKAGELPRVFWNATFGSEEFEAYIEHVISTLIPPPEEKSKA